VKRLFGKQMAGLWTRDLVTMVIATFLLSFGNGALNGARANFFVDTLGLSSGQVLWLEGLRELPGIALMFIAALTMHLPLVWRGVVWTAVLGLGYMGNFLVYSLAGLIMAEVVASFGLHGYQPVGPALGMYLATENARGRVLGTLSSVGSLATIVGMGVLALTSKVVGSLSLRVPYLVGGAFIILAALAMTRLPRGLGKTEQPPPRMLLSRRYWLYYVLTFFEGSRKQVLGTFGTLVLVQFFGWEVWQISSLLLVIAVATLVLAPFLGSLVDRFGSRRVLVGTYAVLVLCCASFAVVRQPMVLAALVAVIRLALILNMGLSIYVKQIAPPEELLPTLSAGVSINHVSSVAMPLVAGALMPIIGYGGVFLMTAGLIALSIPFAAMMGGRKEVAPQVEPALGG
jgi:MFS family permease